MNSICPMNFFRTTDTTYTTDTTIWKPGLKEVLCFAGEHRDMWADVCITYQVRKRRVI